MRINGVIIINRANRNRGPPIQWICPFRRLRRMKPSRSRSKWVLSFHQSKLFRRQLPMRRATRSTQRCRLLHRIKPLLSNDQLDLKNTFGTKRESIQSSWTMEPIILRVICRFHHPPLYKYYDPSKPRITLSLQYLLTLYSAFSSGGAFLWRRKRTS